MLFYLIFCCHKSVKCSISVTQSLINDIRSRIPDDTSIDVEAQGPVKFSIWVSFAEIYNEYIYDLLEAMPRTKKVRRQALKLSEDKNGSIFVKGKNLQIFCLSFPFLFSLLLCISQKQKIDDELLLFYFFFFLGFYCIFHFLR